MTKSITDSTAKAEPEARRSMTVVITGFLNSNHCECFADAMRRAFVEGQTAPDLTVSVLPMSADEANRLSRRLMEPAKSAAFFTRDGILPKADGPAYEPMTRLLPLLRRL